MIANRTMLTDDDIDERPRLTDADRDLLGLKYPAPTEVCDDLEPRHSWRELATMVLAVPLAGYLWIEFIKLCIWLGQFTWP